MYAQPTYEHFGVGEGETSDETELVPLPSTLETTGSKLVYLSLHVSGEATVNDLVKTLDMKMLTLYPVLETLENEDLIERDGATFTTVA